MHLTTFSQQKNEILKMLYMRLLKLKEDTQSITNLNVTHWYFRSLKGSDIPCTCFATGFCKICRLVHFVKCV